MVTKFDGKWEVPYWGIRCINAGFDGAKTSDILDLLGKFILDVKPNGIIYEVGDNDERYQITPEEYQKNLDEICNRIKGAGVKDVIISSDVFSSNPDIRKRYMPYMEKIKLVVDELRLPFVDVFNAMKKYDLKKIFNFVSGGNDVVGMKPGDIDFLHPNQYGNAVIAKILVEELLGVKFDPDLYMKTTSEGKMFPSY
jgi:lysophospholipase L1-like esterase